MQSTNLKPLVGSVFERRPLGAGSGASGPSLRSGAEKTGFPAVKRRIDNPNPGSGIGANGKPKGKSSFLRSREGISMTPEVPIPGPMQTARLGGPRAPADFEKEDTDWREQISRENEMKVASMTDEERERERQEILERFGDGIGQILRKAKAKRLAMSKQESDLTADLNEGKKITRIFLYPTFNLVNSACVIRDTKTIYPNQCVRVSHSA
jgi:RNA polymerase II-associated protein 1